MFTSTCENAGSFALYDGLHAGVPTICSDRSSMPEMVAGAVRLVNPNEPDRLATAIVEVLAHPDQQERLAVAADQWSAAAPTWPSRAGRLVEFLDQLGSAR